MSRAPRSVPVPCPPQARFQAGQGLARPPQEHITSANAAVDKSLQHNYIGRKEKKRNFRALWIQRINAACREHGLTYSRFISGLAVPASRSTARSSPTSPSTSPPPSRLWWNRRPRLNQTPHRSRPALAVFRQTVIPFRRLGMT
jgi:large subunit ribosomal protein L20